MTVVSTFRHLVNYILVTAELNRDDWVVNEPLTKEERQENKLLEDTTDVIWSEFMKLDPYVRMMVVLKGLDETDVHLDLERKEIELENTRALIRIKETLVRAMVTLVSLMALIWFSYSLFQGHVTSSTLGNAGADLLSLLKVLIDIK